MPPGPQRRKRGGSSMRGRRRSSLMSNQPSEEELLRQKQRELLQLNRLKCTDVTANGGSGILKDQAEIFPYKRRSVVNFLRDRKLIDVLTLHNVSNRRIQAKSLKQHLPTVEELQKVYLNQVAEVEALQNEIQFYNNDKLLEKLCHPVMSNINSFNETYVYLQNLEQKLYDKFRTSKDLESNHSGEQQPSNLSVVESVEKEEGVSIGSHETLSEISDSKILEQSTVAESTDMVEPKESLAKENCDVTKEQSLTSPAKSDSSLYKDMLQKCNYTGLQNVYNKVEGQLESLRNDLNQAPTNYWKDEYPKYLASWREKEEEKAKAEAARKLEEEKERENQRIAAEVKKQQELQQKESFIHEPIRASDLVPLSQPIISNPLFQMNPEPVIPSSVPISVAANSGFISAAHPMVPVPDGITNPIRETPASAGQPQQILEPRSLQPQPAPTTSLLDELNDPAIFGRNSDPNNVLQPPSQTDVPQDQQAKHERKQSTSDYNYFNDFGTFDTEFGDNPFPDFDPAFF